MVIADLASTTVELGHAAANILRAMVRTIAREREEGEEARAADSSATLGASS